jgi:hypothetical protein
MTPTSSFTSCLLGITESNHLYYSAFYSVDRTPQILWQWHPDPDPNVEFATPVCYKYTWVLNKVIHHVYF